METLIITPKTKIFDLLQAYPALEETLIASAPEFKKLRNPILRNTIARVTTISQAASVAGIKVEELVNVLREKTGQGRVELLDETGSRYNLIKPSWFRTDEIVNTIDAGEMLNHDEQPVHRVLSEIKNLKEDQILEVIAPFVPAPLIDKALSLGYPHWLSKISEGEYRVYFRK